MKARITVYRVKTEEIEVEVDIPKVPTIANSTVKDVVDYAESDNLAGTIAIEQVKASTAKELSVNTVNVTYETGVAIVDDWSDFSKQKA